MIGAHPYKAAAGFTFSRGGNAIRCACGGWIRLSSEGEYGRTLETCDGSCKYVGAPRVDADVAELVARERAKQAALDVSRPCTTCGELMKPGRRRNDCGRCTANRPKGNGRKGITPRRFDR